MKKIIIAGLIIVLLLGAGLIYLNNVFLPKTIKAMIIRGIEEQTNSQVTLGALRVNVFKGLVLRDLAINKEGLALLKVKEVSCILLPWSLLEKKIAIPIVSLNSAQIFLERRKDNTFNLADLFTPKPQGANAPLPESTRQTKPSSAKKGFAVFIYRINISNSKVVFQDSTFNQPFIKTLENVNLAVYLSLPASVKFKLSAVIPGVQPAKISGSGEFKIRDQALNAKLEIVNFSPHEFFVYYAASGLKISGDSFHLLADIKLKNNVFYVDAQAQGENFNLSRDEVSIRASMDLRAALKYGLSEKKLEYSGSSKIYNTDISGIKLIDKIKSINCGIVFDSSGLSAENFSAQILGLSVKGKAVLADFSDPKINVNIVSSLDLALLQDILKNNFKFNFPGSLKGNGGLSLLIEGKLSTDGNLAVSGNLDISAAELKLDKLAQSIQGISGKLEFSRGSLVSPVLLAVGLSSGDISLDSALSFSDRLVKISKCSGRYYLSKFATSGSINLADNSQPQVDLTGELLIDLKDLDKLFPKLAGQFTKIKPEGKVRAQFNLSGNINEPQDYNVEAKLSSDSISLYGLKGTGFVLNYIQEDGIASMPLARLSLYGGSMEAAFRASLGPESYPYLLNVFVKEVKAEELKVDTQAKAKDIAGIINGELKCQGFLSDLLNSQGAGALSITKGKLWELDLFKGMGKLLFSKDFANITFSAGQCAFIIRDRSISTDNLILSGSMVNLSGPVKIGFDSSIDARLNVDIVSELVPLTGTYKDVTTAIINEAGKFAVIRISGTLKEPKYKFEAAVADIIKGIAGTLFKSI